MVLGDLGEALTSAFAKLSRSSTVDEDTLKATLKDIAAALMRSDVNIKMVGRLRDNVMAKMLPLLAEGEDGAPASSRRASSRSSCGCSTRAASRTSCARAAPT